MVIPPKPYAVDKKKRAVEAARLLQAPALRQGLVLCSYFPELEADACGCEFAFGTLT